MKRRLVSGSGGFLGSHLVDRLLLRSDLERFVAIDDPGPLNIGDDREISVLAAAEYVASVRPGARIQFGPSVVQDPTSWRPGHTLARRVLPGCSATGPYERGVALALDWFRTKPKARPAAVLPGAPVAAFAT